MTTIKKATGDSDYSIIENLASIIWHEHYTPIIGLEQVTYMLHKFQSSAAICKQVENGMDYFIINFNEIPVGYIGLKKEQDHLSLSKLYVLEDYRGKKIGKTALLFIENKVRENKLSKLVLTVNKYNTNSIQAYLKLGFIKKKAIVQDIGNGFIMDDYLLEKTIS